MKRSLLAAGILGLCWFGACARQEASGCFVGAFLGDVPSSESIDRFQKEYGKKPFLVLTFLDWGKYPAESVIRDVYAQNCVLMVTWEPWVAATQKGIDYDALLAGKEDGYIRTFALRIKSVGKTVFLRFAHEMNGDWYPWSGQKIGGAKYQRLFRHVRNIFDQVGAGNVQWVFSLNAENVPRENDSALCYPGDRYVDYVGLDGYNWGTTQSWSRWKSFRDIFLGVYDDVVRRYKKPVIVSEFSSSSAGGDKALWIEDALQTMRHMPAVKGFILFNVDKEVDWRFPPNIASGQKLRSGLADPYFQEALKGSLS
ncbi:MAG: glycosyl hydrolase [Candidatus Omnitrophica bacterium]|nr:glycosyl hydrolase [Candidatus Omnitrophota bacterium]